MWGLEFAGLTDRRRDHVNTYSGGMQRRLNLVCALMHDPPIILLDEPTAGVDPQSRNHLFDRIEELAEMGRTIIYTTHYMEEAERLCDRVAIVDHGRLLALETTDTLIQRHGGRSTVEVELEEANAKGEKTLRWEATEPLLEVMRLSEQGVRLRTLRIDRPNLETVFLNLTGHRLRDA
jgi:ABC-2 type transport system ATP-binding protein